jgi:hypothetical protein
LKPDLAHELEARLAEQSSHCGRGYAVDLASPHPAAPGFILVEEQMRDAAGERSDHRGQEVPLRPEYSHHREERCLAVWDVIERRDYADGVERTVAERQVCRVPDPDVDAFPGKYVGAETASVDTREVVVSAGKVEETPANKRADDAMSPRFEEVHPASRGLFLVARRAQLDARGLRNGASDCDTDRLLEHSAQYHGSGAVLSDARCRSRWSSITRDAMSAVGCGGGTAVCWARAHCKDCC